MSDDIENCCRICLDLESDHVSIIGDPTICLHLKACLAVSVSSNDHLPKTICVSCVSLLSQFYNFQQSARCSQDWLESSLQEKVKKTAENKVTLQPLPDSEYNSDSLLEFLNNTANIEEYLNNLGKEDIPCIVNMLDSNEHNIEAAKGNLKAAKVSSPKEKDAKKIKIDTDVLESDFSIVKGLVKKDTDLKVKINQVKIDKNTFICFGCKLNYDNVTKLLQHMSLCDIALRTCIHCDLLFNSKQQMQQHSITHNTSLPFTCNCGEQFQTKEKLIQHHKSCCTDYAASVGYVYRCKECGDTFKERFQLYKHAKVHIIKAEEKVCDICGHTFMGTDTLMKHKKEVHEKVDNVKYRCKICNFTSLDHKEIYLHVKYHNVKSETSLHLCESCGRSFATRITLNRHMLQHGADKAICDICKKYFPDIKVLKEHMIEHTNMTMCEKCGQCVNSFKLDLHTCV